MSRVWSCRSVVGVSIVLLGSIAIPDLPAHASVTLTDTFNASGFASGDPHRLTHRDTGTYSSIGQIGRGRYRFESTYWPGGCAESTYTGTAEFVRSDGARLTGTLTGQSECIGPPLEPPLVLASYTLDLTGGSGDFVRARFAVSCSWHSDVTVLGKRRVEECDGSGNVIITRRFGYAIVDDHWNSIGFGGLPFAYAVTGSSTPPTDLAITPSRSGYWFVNGAGRVFVRGDAKLFGRARSLRSAEVVQSIAATPKGDGYWLFTSRGRVLPFGAAKFLGDMHATSLSQPIVDAAATADGKGYWMAASDGGVFTFGSARFFGSTGAMHLNQPVVGFAPTATGRGYWLAAADGGVFTFGDAPFRGSMGGRVLERPVTGVARYGGGYLLLATDGTIFNFGTLPFFGSLAGQDSQPVVSVAAVG